MMKNNLKILSLTAFVLAIPALIIVDWFYRDYGIGVMFLLLTMGLVCDQVIRRNFPKGKVTPLKNYRINKLLNLLALVLFLQSPMALIYGNKAIDKLGFWLMAVMICFGIVLNQIASIKFGYQTGRKKKSNVNFIENFW